MATAGEDFEKKRRNGVHDAFRYVLVRAGYELVHQLDTVPDTPRSSRIPPDRSYGTLGARTDLGKRRSLKVGCTVPGDDRQSERLVTCPGVMIDHRDRIIPC